MKEYAILKVPTTSKFNAGIVHLIAKGITDKIEGVSVATHTEPWLVLVRCKEALSPDERERLIRAIQEAG